MIQHMEHVLDWYAQQYLETRKPKRTGAYRDAWENFRAVLEEAYPARA